MWVKLSEYQQGEGKGAKPEPKPTFKGLAPGRGWKESQKPAEGRILRRDKSESNETPLSSRTSTSWLSVDLSSRVSLREFGESKQVEGADEGQMGVG